jgi:hypothetical protein
MELEDHGIKILQLSPKYVVLPEHPNKLVLLKADDNGDLSIDNKIYSIDKLLEIDLESKISVYEDRVRGWFLNYAKIHKEERNAIYLITIICLSYLEGNQQIREGRVSKANETENMLFKALKRMLNIPNEREIVVRLFTRRVRHGLFHDG